MSLSNEINSIFACASMAPSLYGSFPDACSLAMFLFRRREVERWFHSRYLNLMWYFIPESMSYPVLHGTVYVGIVPHMNTDERIAQALERQEAARKRGEKVAGTIGLIVILPILAFVLWAMVVVANA